MEFKARYVKIPYTFILHVLVSKLDEIENSCLNEQDAVKYRTYIDEKLGEIKGFWDVNYNEIAKILDVPSCDYLKQQVLEHIYLRQASNPYRIGDATDTVLRYIEPRWDEKQFDEFKKSVLFEKTTSELFV